MGATPAAPQIHIESVQTGLPTRVVQPDRTRLIAVTSPPLPETVLQHRLRAVLYYRADDALWEEGIWVKESLGEVLCLFPEMAGRLRRRANGSWDVKLNDAGVRFQQATVEVTMEDFLADKGSNEAALAPWINVSAEDPDMCSLLFMQARGCALDSSTSEFLLFSRSFLNLFTSSELWSFSPRHSSW